MGIVPGRSTRSLDVMNRPVEQWWTEKQRALVDDRSFAWHLETFKPSPKWDHEHCELCWSKISLLPGDSPEGYTAEDKWLCSPCYATFIVPREIS